MFKKKKTYIILVLIILVGGWIYYSKTKKPTVEYTTQKAEKGTLAQTVSVTGKVVSQNEIDLSFKLSGRIEAMYVEIGDKVKKGQKIATIDKGTLFDQLRQAQQEVAVQKNTLYDMKTHKRKLTYTWAQEEAQRANIKAAQANVGGLLEQISETVLYAPVNGTVITKNVEVGETTVANAVTANTSVVTIAGEGALEIQANVPESDIVKVALGQKADATLDAFTAQEIFPSEVVEIEPSSTVIQDVVYYKVKLKFPTPDSRFKNGMSADVNIHTAEKNNVIFIPERAIKNDGDRKYVEILKDEKNNIIDKAYVETGMRGDDGMIEIISGLSGGENVITLSKTQ
jgi:RND family efflux transporter MFP subunit